MTNPTFEAFQASARSTLVTIGVPYEELKLLDAKGPSFDFYADGGVDSLDMLDVVFYIDRDLGVKINFDKLILDEKPVTLQNLYGAIRKDAHLPA
jgi:acyl carrier protein